MISIPLYCVENVISKNKVEIDAFIKENKVKIEKLLVKPIKNLNKNYTVAEDKKFNKHLDYFNHVKSENCQINYLNYLISNFQKIILSTPEELDSHRLEFNKIIDEKVINKKFREIIIETLNYKYLRANFYPKYFNGLGLKACVYCNSQLAIISNGNSAHFEVDHYLPKDKLPCFAISFYNLYPICGSCNKRKLDKEVEFQLYKTDILLNSKSEFSFEIEISSLANYFISNDSSDIEIIFNEPINKTTNFDKIFKINGVYNTQKDIAEELILKSKIYNENYKKSLIKSFSIFNKVNLGNRIIIGNYTKENEIHNRPMAKFTQDISRQLGLLD
nr:hypothetical protein [uncultured Flavobacterium sp.]